MQSGLRHDCRLPVCILYMEVMRRCCNRSLNVDGQSAWLANCPYISHHRISLGTKKSLTTIRTAPSRSWEFRRKVKMNVPPIFDWQTSLMSAGFCQHATLISHNLLFALHSRSYTSHNRYRLPQKKQHQLPPQYSFPLSSKYFLLPHTFKLLLVLLRPRPPIERDHLPRLPLHRPSAQRARPHRPQRLCLLAPRDRGYPSTVLSPLGNLRAWFEGSWQGRVGCVSNRVVGRICGRSGLEVSRAGWFFWTKWK